MVVLGGANVSYARGSLVAAKHTRARAGICVLALCNFHTIDTTLASKVDLFHASDFIRLTAVRHGAAPKANTGEVRHEEISGAEILTSSDLVALRGPASKIRKNNLKRSKSFYQNKHGQHLSSTA